MNNFELAKELFLDGRAYLEAEDFSQAECKFIKSLELIPDRASTLTNLSAVQFKLKKYSEARATAQKAISVESDNSEAYLNLGLIEKELQNFESALKFFDKALSLKPDYAESWSNKGNVLNELKRYDEAIAHFDKALSLKPDYAESWSNKGNVLNELKRYDEAIAHFDKALSLKPDYAESWSNKGNVLNELKRYDEAIAHFDKALSLKPDYAESWSNKGNVLNELKRYDEAIAHFDKALSLKPDYAESWSNKGNVLNELKRYDEAIAHFDKALSLKPDINWVFGDLLHTKMKICSWSGLADSIEILSAKVMANEKVTQPFSPLALNDDTLLHKRSSEVYIQAKYPLNNYLGAISKRSGNQKIRVGYFSADLRSHAVSILTAELFELHNKDGFEIFAFSFGGDDKDPMQLRLSRAFNQFIDVSNLSDMEIAKLSRELCVDIAVDLGGHTARCRTGIFSYRAAPIQLSYIGYLGTMGAGYYDYLLADRITIPEELQKSYSEKIAYIPSYQANDRTRSISDKIFTRADLGLPETGFIFCCFNSNYKILPTSYDCWMRILNAVEDSVLFLYAENHWAEENLKKEAKARGINSSRLVFGKRMPNDEYLSRYQICDLFLDTFPYNAGTTASDALWVGLPVLTLIGRSFASRVAASILSAIELSELITNTRQEYEGLAIELAKNPHKLAQIKKRLKENRLTAPLFDTPLFTKNLEAAYIKMHERYRNNKEPDHICIV
jgi:protein O-GlcNAc transferase